MNTLQWEPAPTLPSAIEQLKLMADARQSPVIALMKSLEYQGGAGALRTSLADTLVTKAQHVFSGKITGLKTAQPDPRGRSAHRSVLSCSLLHRAMATAPPAQVPPAN